MTKEVWELVEVLKKKFDDKSQVKSQYYVKDQYLTGNLYIHPPNADMLYKQEKKGIYEGKWDGVYANKPKSTITFTYGTSEPTGSQEETMAMATTKKGTKRPISESLPITGVYYKDKDAVRRAFEIIDQIRSFMPDGITIATFLTEKFFAMEFTYQDKEGDTRKISITDMPEGDEDFREWAEANASWIKKF